MVYFLERQYNFFVKMNRNSQTKALILTLKQVGENNRLVTFFSSDKGIFSAILYGGAKSKLRSLVSPFHSGTLYLYHDTHRNSYKITDFDATSFRPTLRENLYKNWAASLCAELLIKTCATGENLFVLANGFLDGLDLSEEKECKLGTIRFLWRYQAELGIQPNTEYCCICGENLIEKNCVYNPMENGFMCNQCDTNINDSVFLPIDKKGISYLNAINNHSPKEVRQITITPQTFNNLQEIVFYLTEKAVDGHLKTLESSKLL